VPREVQEAAGGCIHHSVILTCETGRRWFIKLSRPDRAGMFEAERAGLDAIARTRCMRVPGALCTGADAKAAWLVLEYLDLAGTGDSIELARALAAMHRHGADRFGWHRDNHIGATPQVNAWHPDWATFWCERRLLHQLRLARGNGLPAHCVDRGERLASRVAEYFQGYAPHASLLHGDLWRGNVAYAGGRPVVFDPAVYHGDRETDLAMTELFGGFDAHFYAAYREAWPLDPGYDTRKHLYNLYHVLNHFNLFGAGYGNQACTMIARLLAALG